MKAGIGKKALLKRKQKDRNKRKARAKVIMPATITIDNLIVALANRPCCFNKESAEVAVSGLIRFLRRYAVYYGAKEPTKAFRTDEGMGLPNLPRNALIVGMVDENLLNLDNAEQALDTIEDTISELCQKAERNTIRFGNLEFTFLEKINHKLTPAEKSLMAKLEEETPGADEEDKRESKELLKALKEEISRRTERPRFEILFHS